MHSITPSASNGFHRRVLSYNLTPMTQTPLNEQSSFKPKDSLVSFFRKDLYVPHVQPRDRLHAKKLQSFDILNSEDKNSRSRIDIKEEKKGIMVEDCVNAPVPQKPFKNYRSYQSSPVQSPFINKTKQLKDSEKTKGQRYILKELLPIASKTLLTPPNLSVPSKRLVDLRFTHKSTSKPSFPLSSKVYIDFERERMTINNPSVEMQRYKSVEAQVDSLLKDRNKERKKYKLLRLVDNEMSKWKLHSLFHTSETSVPLSSRYRDNQETDRSKSRNNYKPDKPLTGSNVMHGIRGFGIDSSASGVLSEVKTSQLGIIQHPTKSPAVQTVNPQTIIKEEEDKIGLEAPREFETETLNQIYGGTEDLNYPKTSFAYDFATDLLARGFTFDLEKPHHYCYLINGFGKSPEKLVATLQKTLYNQLLKFMSYYSEENKTQSDQSSLHWLSRFMELLSNHSLRSADLDLLHNGCSLTIGYIEGEYLHYATIGGNIIYLLERRLGGGLRIVESSCPRHNGDNAAEVERILESNEDVEVGVGRGGEGVVLRDKQGIELRFATTRAIGMMAGLPYGLKDKPEFGKISMKGYFGAIITTSDIWILTSREELEQALDQCLNSEYGRIDVAAYVHDFLKSRSISFSRETRMRAHNCLAKINLCIFYEKPKESIDEYMVEFDT